MLAVTEGWIGFSSYGMQSLLVLYMARALFRPSHSAPFLGFAPFRAALGLLYGPLSTAALPAAIMGFYAALLYATPILGGLLADRWLGRTRTIVLGAVLMTAGHVLMAFEPSFLLALACLVAGMGCAGSIKAQLGSLYGTDDPRRADGFQIYAMSVCIAVIVSPLVCGALGEDVAWRWGFLAAGAGMLIGLLTYLLGLRWLPPEPVRTAGQAHPALEPGDGSRLALLVLLLPVLALACCGNMQIFDAYLIWAQRRYDLVLFGHAMPASWLLSLDGFIGTLTLLVSVLFWRAWSRRRRTPDEILKMSLGAILLALAPLILALACWRAGTGRIGLGWALAFHVVNDLGFSNLYAVGLALYARVAPRHLAATVINGYVLSLFLSNLLVGHLGGLLGTMSDARFWLLHAGLITLAALTLLLVARFSSPILAPERH